MSMRSDAAEDLAEAADLRVERVGDGPPISVPAVLQQFLGAGHPVAMCDQVLEDGILQKA